MVTTFINRWETRGQFGDSFGALNTIFSGITLVTVVVTLYYQNKANKEGNISKKYELILSRIQELQQIIRVDVILKKVEDDIFNGDIELERLTDLRSDEELDIAEANDGNVGAFDRYIKINHYWFTVFVSLVSSALEAINNIYDNESLKRAYATTFKSFFTENELKCLAIYSILSDSIYAKTLYRYFRTNDLLENVYIIGVNMSDQVSQVDNWILHHFPVPSSYDDFDGQDL
ncbi:Uncharacterized protein TXXE_04480 [Thermobacillus xylanilyticus]|uniref:Phage abortive infection protein n=2 Tax=Thermobacillus xylanilyticus TaxID=76633 RepID=A0ABM8V1J7_THEXY|nr:Uncharacterized protein TXXE_04480 [Thermobacillus xylanilyticus]